jgi:hypothetical protein
MWSKQMNQSAQRIAPHCDGVRTSVEIAKLVGLSPRYVRRLMLHYGLPQPGRGAPAGERNHQFAGGRRVGLDGYVLVSAPKDHPFARQRKNRPSKLIPEHRLVTEKTLGRHLQPQEVVDHIDGLTLHNAPSNLRLFASNADHLRATLKGRRPLWSVSGRLNILERFDLPEDRARTDIHRRRKERGDVRLLQILLAALSLGIDSPFLLGTSRHIEQAQIDLSSRSTIERALADLSARWEADLSQ